MTHKLQINDFGKFVYFDLNTTVFGPSPKQTALSQSGRSKEIQSDGEGSEWTVIRDESGRSIEMKYGYSKCL